MTAGARSLLERLALGRMRLGALFLTGLWTAGDVEWCIHHGHARLVGDWLEATDGK